MASISTIKPKSQPRGATVKWLDDAIERGKSGVFTEVVTVTPGIAGELLRRNNGNRGLRAVKAHQYATDMLNNQWSFNGEPIIVSGSGELNDGQHRMQAVIDANVTQPFLFVFGVSRESRKTVDQGAARTASDYLAMDGVKNAATAAGCARLLLAYEKAECKSLGRRVDVTNSQVTERVVSDSGIGEAASFAASVQSFARGILPPSVIAFCYYCFAELDEPNSADFLSKVCIGESIKRGDPQFAVRNALAGLEDGRAAIRVEIVFRGWNAFRAGRSLKIAKTLGNLPALV